ncbi:manganese catalase family protein [Indiicoccus explosivorum]|uniref:manganese catalase family protein n=1 Tax=Indiicoccus explosivorum TaxID=1917864 RepID=UPI000B43FD83|nr:manganese catalase family protein [Indiicoccus explosivorum]
MFFHKKELQFEAKPERPDPVFAKKLQEVLGGQYGEMSIFMQYLFQGWNLRGNEKYKDLLLDIGTEEIAHVEILATLIARLLDGSIYDQEKASDDPAINAILSGSNPQHAIVSGMGAMPKDSVGVPWNSGYIVASGNLLADFRANLNMESQGRLQVARLYGMTDDPGVKETLSFLIARDTMHQNQWIASIKDLESKEGVVTPSTFPSDLEPSEYSHAVYNCSEGEESSKLDWLKMPAPDGSKISYEQGRPFGSVPKLEPAHPKAHDTLPMEDVQSSDPENPMK